MLSHISMTLMSGPRDGEILRFDVVPHRNTVITFGRRDTCDISLPYDSQVSRLHAQVIYDGEHFWLEDLDSRNGTFIERQQIEGKVPLTPGVLFRVGRTWLRLDTLPPDETQSAEQIVTDENFDPPF